MDEREEKELIESVVNWIPNKVKNTVEEALKEIEKINKFK